jgi:hypothetical protein
LAVADVTGVQDLRGIGGIVSEPNPLRTHGPADPPARLQWQARNCKLDAVTHVDAVGGDRSTISDVFGSEQPCNGFIGRSRKHLANGAGLQHTTGIEQKKVICEEDGLN